MSRQSDFQMASSSTMTKTAKTKAIPRRALTRRIIVGVIWAFVTLTFLLAGALTVVGQDQKYYEDKVTTNVKAYDENQHDSESEKKKARSKARKLQTECRDFLRGQGSMSESKFNAYFDLLLFPQMTAADEISVGKLGESRAEFFKLFMGKDVGGSKRGLINSVTAKKMSKIIASKENYHPAVRHNAILILGAMDTIPSQDSSSLPRPYTPALEVLLKTLEAQNTPDYLKVGAMVGIQRHLEIGRASGNFSAAAKNRIQQASISMLNAPVPEGATADKQDVKYWLSRRSAQCLGIIGDAGQGGTALAALRKTVKEETNSVWLRFDALSALAQMRINVGDKDKVAGISYEISQFVGAAMDFEAQQLSEKVSRLIVDNRLQENVDLKATGSSDDKTLDGNDGPSGIGSIGDGGSNKKKDKEEDKEPTVEVATYHLNIARRRAKLIAFSAKEALQNKRGIAAVVSDDEKEFIKNMIPVLEKAITDVNKGIIQLDAKDDEDEKEEDAKGDTESMIDALVGISERINDQLPESKKAAPKAEAKAEVKAEAPPAGSDAEPAGDD